MKLSNKIAIITGAGRGIGRAIAIAFAKEGAKVSLVARTISELEETAQLIEEYGSTSLVIPTDVTQPSSVASMVQETVSQYGRVDILVNNAGVPGPIGALQNNKIDDWIKTIQVNVIGPYLCCKSVVPLMTNQGGGKIINLAGAGANNAWANLSAYCTSKAGVVRMTEVLALELENKNIQVNALGPGSIHTRMWEELRNGAEAANATKIQEIGDRVLSGGGASLENPAELAVFLASDDSGKLSGRLISAVTDDFNNIAAKIPEIMESEAFTLRRLDLD